MTSNIWDIKIAQWKNNRPTQVALKDESCAFSYLDLDTYTKYLHNEFYKLDLKPNEIAIIVMPRNAISALVMHTLLRRNIIGLFIDPKIPTNELDNIIESTSPKLIISTLENIVNPKYKKLELAFNFDKVKFKLNAYSGGQSASSAALPQDLRWLLRTSGSTGKIKAVMISGESLEQRANEEIENFDISSNDVILNCLPFSHDLGLNQILTSLYMGIELRIKSRSLPRLEEYLSQNKEITGISGTPMMWSEFLKGYDGNTVLPNLKYLTVSGGKLPLPLLKQLAAFFPKTRIIKTYGQTETFRTFIDDDPTTDLLGRVVQKTQIKLTDDNVLIHFSKTQMLGYLFDDNLTNEKMTIDEDYGAGVITGDIIYHNGNGDYSFLGRKDDIIKRFEQRFHLSEVDSCLGKLPGVRSSVTIAVPTSTYDIKQMYLGTYVQLKQESLLSEKNIMDYLFKNLPYYKTPDYLTIVQEFPMTSTLKVDYICLKKMLEQEQLKQNENRS